MPQLLPRAQGEVTNALSKRDVLVTWQDPTTRSIMPIGRLNFDGSTYSFGYIEASAEAFDAGFRGIPGLRKRDRRFESQSLFPFFVQRSLDPTKPDYDNFLRELGLDREPTPLEQLIHSGGRRAADTIQLAEIPRIDSGTLTGTFLVHGVRHVPTNSFNFANETVKVTGEQHESAIREVEREKVLTVVPEPGNVKTNKALVLTSPSGIPVGHVPDALLFGFHAILDHPNFRVRVFHVNGPEAPSHLRIIAQVEVEDYLQSNPFFSPDFEFTHKDPVEI